MPELLEKLQFHPLSPDRARQGPPCSSQAPVLPPLYRGTDALLSGTDPDRPCRIPRNRGSVDRTGVAVHCSHIMFLRDTLPRLRRSCSSLSLATAEGDAEPTRRGPFPCQHGPISLSSVPSPVLEGSASAPFRLSPAWNPGRLGRKVMGGNLELSLAIARSHAALPSAGGHPVARTPLSAVLSPVLRVFWPAL